MLIDPSMNIINSTANEDWALIIIVILVKLLYRVNKNNYSIPHSFYSVLIIGLLTIFILHSGHVISLLSSINPRTPIGSIPHKGMSVP